MIGELGQGLIFILSQPRSGSTMLQRMLAAYPQVHTTQEPAIALYPLMGLQALNKKAIYETEAPHIFVRSFLQALPKGVDTYAIALRKMLQHIYRDAMDKTEASFFLDKTPHYFSIITELATVFPQAHYVVLMRNPLAVLASVLNTWVQGEWLGVAHARLHLLAAPRLLLMGRELLGTQAYNLNYEDLVKTPEAVMKPLCRYLGLNYNSDFIDYGMSNIPHWTHGDQKSVYHYTRPEPAIAEKWVESLVHPQVWRLSRDYLNTLGRDIIHEMGYNFDELSTKIETHTPSRPGRWLTFSMDWLIRCPPSNRPLWERRLVWLLHRLHSFTKTR